jgi:hypothetical protein
MPTLVNLDDTTKLNKVIAESGEQDVLLFKHSAT